MLATFEQNFFFVSEFVGVFEELIRENISELYDHLKDLGILHMISLSWFLTLFLRYEMTDHFK